MTSQMNKSRYLFYDENDEKHYYMIEIKKSKIENAGLGTFATQKIPKGTRIEYKGKIRKCDDPKINHLYSWTIEEYNESTGECYIDTELLSIDAGRPQDGNWTRYTNCGLTYQDNNLIAKQIFDKLYYVTKRDILPDEELYIDYGIDYRVNILKVIYKEDNL
jgi:SET domain-containing protein